MHRPATASWFGTDALGRDVLARTIYGARISLLVGFLVAAFSVAIGLVIGLVAGSIRRPTRVLMRVMDGLMAIPAILLAIALVSLTRASVRRWSSRITIPEMPRVVRLVRSVVLGVREQPYRRGRDRRRRAPAEDHPCATSCPRRSRR